MKFIHIADTHFDVPYINIGKKANKRRLEVLDAFKKMIKYIKENKVDYLFIAGDFYEHEYITHRTIDYLNDLFKKIPDTEIYISPGNHDPFVPGSIYDTYTFSENVYIFKEYEIIESHSANIHGYGFTDFEDKGIDLNEIRLPNNNKRNIFLVHANLDGNPKDGIYNNISSSKLKSIGFDYVALGHIHKGNFNKNSNIIYPGLFAEHRFSGKTEEHRGAVLGDFTGNYLELELKHFDNKNYIIKKYDISNIKSLSELVIKINDIEVKNDEYYRLEFIGEKNFELNLKYIEDNIDIDNILQFRDNTSLSIDLEEIAEEVSLKGIFVRKSLENINEIEKELNKNEAFINKALKAKDDENLIIYNNVKLDLEKEIKKISNAIYIVLDEIERLT